MWSTSLPSVSRNELGSDLSNSEFLRRYARRLLRDVRSDQTTKAMPVLRRILAVRLMPELRITTLYAIRMTVQLKHVLHMLARELGYSAWETCKQAIDRQDGSTLDRYRLDLGMFNDHQQNWFADMPTAQEWQRTNGGYVVQYGSQAVAILTQ